MRFIDLRVFDFNDIHRPHPGPHANWWCKMCHQSDLAQGNAGQKSTFDLRLLGLWGVMNIINGIARGVSPCVRAPPRLAAEERMLWERSTYESGVEAISLTCCGIASSNFLSQHRSANTVLEGSVGTYVVCGTVNFTSLRTCVFRAHAFSGKNFLWIELHRYRTARNILILHQRCQGSQLSSKLSPRHI